MKNAVCYIIGAGDAYEGRIIAGENDLIICADAGLKNMGAFSREPDFIVGDFDSLGKVPDGNNVEVYPPEKDDTDMLIAIKKGFEKGYSRFVILGALGGERFDHSVANIQNLAYICKRGGVGCILHKDTVLLAVRNSSVTFSESCRGYVSVFSLTEESLGVTEENLKYVIDDFTLLLSEPRGVSNEFIGEKARVSVKDGTLLIIWRGSIEDCTSIHGI